MITFLVGMATGTIIQSIYMSYDMVKRTEYYLEKTVAIYEAKEKLRKLKEDDE